MKHFRKTCRDGSVGKCHKPQVASILMGTLRDSILVNFTEHEMRLLGRMFLLGIQQWLIPSLFDAMTIEKETAVPHTWLTAYMIFAMIAA